MAVPRKTVTKRGLPVTADSRYPWAVVRHGDAAAPGTMERDP